MTAESAESVKRGDSFLRGGARCVVAILALWSTICAGGQQVPGATSLPSMDLTLRTAAEATLSKNPLLFVQQAQVDIAVGRHLQASAIFNTQLVSQLLHNWLSQPLTAYQTLNNASPSFNGTLDRSSDLLFTNDATKLFRNGISVGAHLQGERLLDNISSRSGNNFSTLSLTGTLPLLRGRGRQVVAAQEVATNQEVEATRNDLGQQTALFLANVAGSYWQLVASQKLLEIALASEDRARTYRSNVQTLVDADQAPKGDLSQVEANLAQRTSQRIVAEQSVVADEQQLLLNVGFSLAEIAQHSFAASDPFPSPPERGIEESVPDVPASVGVALARRDDYAAAQQRVVEQQTLLVAARNGIRARLDLSGSAGYSGLQSGRKLGNFLDAYGSGIRGPNAQAALTFSYPVDNEAAKGVLLQSLASLRQAQAQAEQLRHQISAEVRTSHSALLQAARQTLEAARAVQASQAALQGEREKYKVGMGSIVDLVTVEDRLNAALGNQVQAQLTMANSIAQFRYATGTLVTRNNVSFSLLDNVFDTLPQIH